MLCLITTYCKEICQTGEKNRYKAIIIYIIKIIVSPKVAFIEGDNNKLVTKIESSIGNIYYDNISDNVKASVMYL